MTLEPASVLLGVLLGAALSQTSVWNNNIVGSPDSGIQQSQPTVTEAEPLSTER